MNRSRINKAIAIASIASLIAVATTLSACSSSTENDSKAATQGLPDTLQSLEANPWVLDGEASEPPVKSSQIITVGFDKDLISGHGGCNSYRGEFKVKDHDLSVGPLSATRMACEKAEDTAAETAFLQALESAKSVDTTDRTRLVITTTAGKLVFKAHEESGS